VVVVTHVVDEASPAEGVETGQQLGVLELLVTQPAVEELAGDHLTDILHHAVY
jgi:hypothetical protein